MVLGLRLWPQLGLTVSVRVNVGVLRWFRVFMRFRGVLAEVAAVLVVPVVVAVVECGRLVGIGPNAKDVTYR